MLMSWSSKTLLSRLDVSNWTKFATERKNKHPFAHSLYISRTSSSFFFILTFLNSFQNRSPTPSPEATRTMNITVCIKKIIALRPAPNLNTSYSINFIHSHSILLLYSCFSVKLIILYINTLHQSRW